MAPRLVVPLASLGCFFALSVVADARQDELYRRDGRRGYSDFGARLAPMGDVDGDGSADFVVTAPYDSKIGSYSGWVSLRSGRDGLVLWNVFGASPTAGLGAKVLANAGDLTGDGIAELLVSDDLNVDVLSGSDGSLVRTLVPPSSIQGFGASGTDVGDMDGDGIDDAAIGALDWQPKSNASVYFISGADGSLLGQIDHPTNGDWFGAAVAATGDLDQDGVPDVAVGAPRRDPNSVTDAGAVFVYSGATGALLFRVLGDQQDERVGEEIAAGFDLDGDAIGDLVVGFPRQTITDEYQGAVRAYSGATGAMIWERLGNRVHDALGREVALSDADGDGVAELLVHAGYDYALDVSFRVELLAPDGTLLHEWIEPPKDGNFGHSLLVVGDVDGDHVSDFAMGAPEQDDGSKTWPGALFAYKGAEVWLNASPKQVDGGATLDTTIRGGVPGNLALRFVVDVSGTAFFVPLLPVVPLDSVGDASFTEVVPTGLTGNTVTLRAYTIGASGKLVATNRERIELK